MPTMTRPKAMAITGMGFITSPYAALCEPAGSGREREGQTGLGSCHGSRKWMPQNRVARPATSCAPLSGRRNHCIKASGLRKSSDALAGGRTFRLSRRREGGRADERFRAGARVVRIDRESESGRFVRRLAINPAEVFYDIAALGDPLAKPLGAGAHHDISHGAALLALADRAGRCRRIPIIADDARAHRLRLPYPGNVHLGGLVVRRLPAGVAAGGKRIDLPAPLEDRRLVEIDRSFELPTDGRTGTVAPEMQHRPTVVRNDLEIVGRLSPALLLPLARY